ncbi:hypothetical protein [Photobacterium phosphoreum]|uniref:hypothetical protein n=1 Tax=Photobacterium phosphoreum TaxID=659 RepID=UPI001E46BC6F|nr:hypothetical protein [Photobacterium phosphoreum]MCD9508985.1 hypothetical protein [Photobacterium phosphoreum]
MTIFREQLLVMLSESPQAKVTMVKLRKLSRELYPHIDRAERDDLLLYALEELASLQWIRIPRPRTPKAWVKGDKLPCWVDYCDKARIKQTANKEHNPSNEASKRGSLQAVRSRTPWCGKMMKIGPSLPLSQETLRKAVLVNEYMRNRPLEPVPLPVNERSLQLFGYEKTLKNIHKMGMFGGGISLQDLDCYRVSEPLQGVRWPDKAINAPILIVENSTTFYSAWMENNRSPVYSAIVFGRGKMLKGIELATDSLEEIRQESANRSHAIQLPELHYFGDLDPEGVEIPIGINRVRKKHGLEPLYPALILYQRLLTFPEQDPVHDWPKGLVRSDLIDWLGEPIATNVLDAFDRQRRWAQEWISIVTFKEIFTANVK